MDEWERIYREAVNAARATALSANGVPRAAIDQLYILYAQMIRDIDRDFGTGAITQARKEALSNQIRARLDKLSAQLQTTFAVQKRNAVDQSILGHQRALEGVRRLGFNVSANFNDVPDATIDFMLQRRGIHGSKNYQTLIGRGLQDMGPQVDRFLNSAIGRGVSAERASQELAGLIAGKDPNLIGILDNGRLDKNKIKAALKGENIDDKTFQKAQKVLWQSKRIMVTEINTAFREADILSSFESPVVGYKKWEVSGRHYGLWSSPDVCSFYHEADQFGQGAGVFPILNIPSTPHPNCGCFASDVMRNPSEWNQKKPETRQPKRLTANGVKKNLNRAAKSNKQLAKGLERATDNHIKRQVEIANEYNQLAYKWSQRVGKAAS